MFMMKMLEKIPEECFIKEDFKIMGEIYQFECIYLNFNDASKYKDASENLHGMTQFLI